MAKEMEPPLHIWDWVSLDEPGTRPTLFKDEQGLVTGRESTEDNLARLTKLAEKRRQKELDEIEFEREKEIRGKEPIDQRPFDAKMELKFLEKGGRKYMKAARDVLGKTAEGRQVLRFYEALQRKKHQENMLEQYRKADELEKERKRIYGK